MTTTTAATAMTVATHVDQGRRKQQRGPRRSRWRGNAGDTSARRAARGAKPLSWLPEEPNPAVSWAVRWLLWRVMFGFGKLKFVGTDHQKDQLYIRDFMIAQPIPTRLGWLAHCHLPLCACSGRIPPPSTPLGGSGHS